MLCVCELLTVLNSLHHFRGFIHKIPVSRLLILLHASSAYSPFVQVFGELPSFFLLRLEVTLPGWIH
ncbi:unnamed protein product [Alternaria burnsii]|nr:unnamed protein product [Alternaria burnsii]